MSNVLQTHREAMEWAEEAQFMRRRGDQSGARTAFLKAMELERQAAESVDRAMEPDRSILFRSAGSLAIECNELRLAEQLLAMGLAGDPPIEIAEEIRDLLETVHFRRHLVIRGIALQENDVQMSLAGPMVGFGVASSDEIVPRVRGLVALVRRTAERILGQPYRDSGSPPKRLRDKFRVFLTVPQAASFAVTLKLGWPKQHELWDSEADTGVINEILDLLEAIQNQRIDELCRRIPERPYLVNFAGLARKLAPDGKNVSIVGLTARGSSGESREIALTRPRSELGDLTSQVNQPAPGDETASVVQVTETLHYANEIGRRHSSIKLEDENRSVHEIVVPEGMMTDLVRPHWGEVVTVTGIRRDGKIELQEMSPADG